MESFGIVHRLLCFRRIHLICSNSNWDEWWVCLASPPSSSRAMQLKLEWILFVLFCLAFRWQHWRATWPRLGRSTRRRWSGCRRRWASLRTTCRSFGWTCSATRPTTSSCCASSRTWRWRSPLTGACWKGRRRTFAPTDRPTVNVTLNGCDCVHTLTHARTHVGHLIRPTSSLMWTIWAGCLSVPLQCKGSSSSTQK